MSVCNTQKKKSIFSCIAMHGKPKLWCNICILIFWYEIIHWYFCNDHKIDWAYHENLIDLRNIHLLYEKRKEMNKQWNSKFPTKKRHKSKYMELPFIAAELFWLGFSQVSSRWLLFVLAVFFHRWFRFLFVHWKPMISLILETLTCDDVTSIHHNRDYI